MIYFIIDEKHKTHEIHFSNHKCSISIMNEFFRKMDKKKMEMRPLIWYFGI